MRLRKQNLLTVFGLTALVWVVGCGGSKSKENTVSQDFQAKPSQPASQKPASGHLPIPFDIAIQAALAGHQDTVMQALETGTDPNQTDENGRTLLMVSAFNAHVKTMKKLIEVGAKIDTQDFAGRTALMYASTGKDLPTVELLLENKANVNLVDGEEHWSPLMFAAAEGNMEVVKLLLNHGADTSLADIDGEDAELFARNNGHIEVADLIHEWKAKTH